VHVSPTRHTARFVCTTDSAMAQIASFYAGAMSEARDIELRPIADRLGPLDLVVVSPNDPDAMLRHTQECRSRGFPFAADPSQQLAWADGAFIREIIAGAAYLFSNDYEAALTEQKAGWTSADILDRVAVRVVTHGAAGACIHRKGEPDIEVAAVPGVTPVDPTGVGDSFRAGFLAGVTAGLDLRHAAEVGCALAAGVVETTGTQEYVVKRGAFLDRIGWAYGLESADAVAAHLRFRHD